MNMLMIQRGRQQKGFVAIVVAGMLIVFMALITVGFTRLVQREQRQVLDRQLSRQALYAAESGINDVYANLDSLKEEQTTCVGDPANGGVAATTLNPEGTIEYTCVLFDKTPSELTYQISKEKSKLGILQTQNVGVKFSTINLRWGVEDAKNNNPLNNCDEFPASHGGAPVIRLDITDMSDLSRSGLTGNTDSLYLKPCSAGTQTYAFGTGNKGKIVKVAKNGSGSQPYSLSINVGGVSDQFLVRMATLYSPASVTIDAVDSSGNQVGFINAQTVIDVTARSSDVTRRLRATVPLTDPDGLPEAVVQVFNGFCKQYTVSGNSVSDSCAASP